MVTKAMAHLRGGRWGRPRGGSSCRTGRPGTSPPQGGTARPRPPYSTSKATWRCKSKHTCPTSKGRVFDYANRGQIRRGRPIISGSAMRARQSIKRRKWADRLRAGWPVSRPRREYMNSGNAHGDESACDSAMSSTAGRYRSNHNTWPPPTTPPAGQRLVQLSLTPAPRPLALVHSDRGALDAARCSNGLGNRRPRPRFDARHFVFLHLAFACVAYEHTHMKERHVIHI